MTPKKIKSLDEKMADEIWNNYSFDALLIVIQRLSKVMKRYEAQKTRMKSKALSAQKRMVR